MFKTHSYEPKIVYTSQCLGNVHKYHNMFSETLFC